MRCFGNTSGCNYSWKQQINTTQNTLCACTPCLRGDCRKCECLDQFKNYLKPVTMTTHTFSISKKKQKDTVDDEDELIDLDEDEVRPLLVESSVIVQCVHL